MRCGIILSTRLEISQHDQRESSLRPLCLHFCQQLLDPIGLFNRYEAVFDIFRTEFRFGLAHSLVVRDLVLHAIESS